MPGQRFLWGAGSAWTPHSTSFQLMQHTFALLKGDLEKQLEIIKLIGVVKLEVMEYK